MKLSAECRIAEVGDLGKFVADHPDCIVFSKKSHDTGMDEVMKMLVSHLAAEQMAVDVAWVSLGNTPERVGSHRVRGDRNVLIFRDGAVVKRMINLPLPRWNRGEAGELDPAMGCLTSSIQSCFSNEVPAPSPER
ncbi:MAG: hypothetical protein WCP91_00750 [Candidatus Berkelbacteria bacterium]